MAAFRPFGTNTPFGGPVLRKEIVANSITIKVMDSVKISSGFVALGTTGAAVFGHTLNIGSNTGLGLQTSGAAGAQIGSFVDRYLTTSTNQTVAMVRAEIDISKFTLWSAALDAAIGTTTGSNLLNYKIDLADETQLSESSAATSTNQYHIWGVDPNSSSRAIVSIYESSVFDNI